MKLIKLSTTNKFSHFDANFDTDIIINENSSIALKNIVFTPKYHNFTASGETGEMTIDGFSSDTTNLFKKVSLFPQTYRSNEFFGLTQNITNALNRSLSIKSSMDQNNNITIPDDKQICSQFLCYVSDETQRAVIEYRLSPLINCFGDSLIQGEASFMTGTLDKFLYQDDGQIGEDNICSVKTSLPAVDTQEYRLVSPRGTGLCKGNGIFYIQIYSSSVVADPLKNGFSIGLSFFDILGNTAAKRQASSPGVILNPTTIPDTARNIEITFRDGNTNYFVRTSSKGKASIEVDTGVSPGRHSAGTNISNDILIIKVDNNASGQKIITGTVVQYTGTQHLLFTHILSEEEQTTMNFRGENGLIGTGTTTFNPTIFQPYIFYRGNGSTIKTHNARMTFDPFVAPFQWGGDDNKITDDPMDFNNTYLPGFDHQTEYNLLENGLKGGIPFFDSPQRFDDTNQNTGLVLPIHLSSLLGFAPSKIDTTMSVNVPIERMSKYMSPPGNLSGHFIKGSIFHFLEDALFDHSDFFLIESQSLQLESYNSSPEDQPTTIIQSINSTNGTRKSILDTIPVSDINGIIMHEPNELIYINIKNSSKINLRNLKFRILTKDFDEVETTGESHLTLLIKD
tara:strand:+ start:1597 stop:3468 length:1872 start_codon:yes stop_codon:yes gene_type:complete